MSRKGKEPLVTPGRMPNAELLQELLARARVVTYVVRMDGGSGTLLYMSPQAQEILGLAPEELVSATLEERLNRVHPDDRETVAAAGREAELNGSSDGRYRYLHPDGRILQLLTVSMLVSPNSGEPGTRLGLIIDVTEEMATSQALHDSEARYRALVEQVPAIVYEMGPDDERRTIYVSPHVEAILGYSRQEWLDQPDIWAELLHPEDREHELAAHDRHNQTGEPWVRTYRLIAADGRTVWVRDQAVLAREHGQPESQGTWHGVMLDITSQKSAEEDLHITNELLEYRVRERTAELEEANEMMSMEIAQRQLADAERRSAEERYRSLVEQIPAVVYRSTVLPGGPVHADYSSPQVEAMLGYTPEEWNDQLFWVTRIHPHDRDRIIDAWEESKATGDSFSEEFRFLAKDGRIVWVLDETTLLSRDASGRPQRFQGVMMDITARKEAEAAAVDAEARYQALATQGPVMAFVWERDPEGGGRHRYMSPQVERLLGYPMEAWNSDNDFWLSIVHPDDRERVLASEIQTEYTGESWSLDYRVITRSGDVRWLHDEGSLISRDDEGRPHQFHGIYIDITDRKEIEQKLRDTEERYRTLVEQLPAMPWTEEVNTATGHSRITYRGPQTESVLGWSPAELGEGPWTQSGLIHPEDLEEVLRADRDAITLGEAYWDQTFRITARDGSIRTVRSIGRRVTDEDATIQTWKGITIEVGPPRPARQASGEDDADVTPWA